jgi:chlorite dismutase
MAIRGKFVDYDINKRIFSFFKKCLSIIALCHCKEELNSISHKPAKNATKPNPFKIISLKPTRKENNWETEETMERANVTLETERAKWPNPGCS